MKIRTFVIAALCGVLSLGIVACKKKDGVQFYHSDFPAKLADWKLFNGHSRGQLIPAKSVLPYDLNSPLFSDYAGKFRTVWMPAGTSGKYREKDGAVDLPEETILSKTFYYDQPDGSKRLLETRLLIHTSDGWTGVPYVWNEEQTEAVLAMGGGRKDVVYNHSSGKKFEFSYTIPDANACRGCHIEHDNFEKKMVPLGPRVDNLNKDYDYSILAAAANASGPETKNEAPVSDEGVMNQLEKWAAVGYLSGLPADKSSRPRMAAYTDPADGTVADRARGYLHANCAHCHQDKGPANTSGLLLNIEVTAENKLGVCKTPIAAGRGSGGLLYDIVPGKPRESIIYYRMKSGDPGVMMPELARTLLHQEGLDLVAEWIRTMPGDCNTALR